MIRMFLIFIMFLVAVPALANPPWVPYNPTQNQILTPPPPVQFSPSPCGKGPLDSCLPTVEAPVVIPTPEAVTPAPRRVEPQPQPVRRY